METTLNCALCGAKLRIKTAVLKMMKEVRCAKCRQPIPVGPDSAGGEGGTKGGAASAIQFSCAKCGRRISVMRLLTGKKIKCPGCEDVLTVPAEEGPAAEVPAATAAAAPNAVSEAAATLERRLAQLTEDHRKLHSELERVRRELAECLAEVQRLKGPAHA